MRHHIPRQPGKKIGFSWSRVIIDGVVVYRLFRRDQRGAAHYCTRVYKPDEASDRKMIAIEVNRARHALRDQVDEVDLALMGVTQ